MHVVVVATYCRGLSAPPAILAQGEGVDDDVCNIHYERGDETSREADKEELAIRAEVVELFACLSFLHLLCRTRQRLSARAQYGGFVGIIFRFSSDDTVGNKSDKEDKKEDPRRVEMSEIEDNLRRGSVESRR